MAVELRLDTIIGGAGEDRFQGGDGADTITDSAGNGGGDAGADTITTTGGFDDPAGATATTSSTPAMATTASSRHISEHVPAMHSLTAWIPIPQQWLVMPTSPAGSPRIGGATSRRIGITTRSAIACCTSSQAYRSPATGWPDTISASPSMTSTLSSAA